MYLEVNEVVPLRHPPIEQRSVLRLPRVSMTPRHAVKGRAASPGHSGPSTGERPLRASTRSRRGRSTPTAISSPRRTTPSSPAGGPSGRATGKLPAGYSFPDGAHLTGQPIGEPSPRHLRRSSASSLLPNASVRPVVPGLHRGFARRLPSQKASACPAGSRGRDALLAWPVRCRRTRRSRLRETMNPGPCRTASDYR
jgi:hypothetical protein